MASFSLRGCLLIAGPTATGKSEIASQVALAVGGEIVSVDSMQVYRGMDIGTAKPSTAERARVPHHLLDVADITDAFDTARFVELATQAIDDIRKRGRVPILCGGTGLYFKALLSGLGDAPPSDARLRAELEAASPEELLRELAAKDPATFARIDRKNPRRLIRAVEVVRLTGKSFSNQKADWGKPAEETAGRFFGLERSSEDLRQRIDVRVEEMFRRGLVDETARLLKQGLGQNRNAMQALGYRQVAEYLQGMRPLPETIELVKSRTRQYAKRQMTWFRGQLSLDWVRLKAGQEGGKTAAMLVEALRQTAERQLPSEE